MLSELCCDRPVNTLQIVCSVAPLPSAECQASARLSCAGIFHFVLHRQIQQPFQKAAESRWLLHLVFTEPAVKYTCFNQGCVEKHARTP